MTTTIRTRRWLPGVDLTVLVPTLALIAAEVWFLTTQTRDPTIPLMWMAPMDLLLIAYAVEDSLALSMAAMILFFARFAWLPFFLAMTPMNNFLLFYILFMAPVDVFIVGYMITSAGKRVFGSSSAT